LLEAAANGRLLRLGAGGAAVVALLVIAVALFPGRSGAGTTIATQAIGPELTIDRPRVTSSAPAPQSAPTPTRPAGRAAVAFVEPMEQLSEQLAPLVSVTVPGEWIEPEVEPEGEWIDGGNGVRLPDVLLRIRFCESTNNYGAAHVASSARGAYQFLSGSWEWYGHAARYGVAAANQATPAQQDEAALLTFQQDGARPWAESRHCWDDPDIDARYLTARPRPTTTVPATTTPPTSGPSTTAPPASTTTTEATTTSTDGTTTTSEPADGGSSTTVTASP
ncbi:MAG: transglycosylase family protein, partial [Actinomycetota bacterium]